MKMLGGPPFSEENPCLHEFSLKTDEVRASFQVIG